MNEQRRIMDGRELELFEMIEPYIIYTSERQGLSETAPPEIVKAYEELCKLRASRPHSPE